MRDDGVTRAACFVTSALLVVLRLPAVPREPRRGRGRPPGRAAARPAAPLLQPPRLRRGVRRRDPDRAGRPARPGPGGAHLVFVTHSIPERDERAQRPAGAVRTSASTAAWWPRSPTGSARRPAGATRSTSSTARARARPTCRGSSRTSTTTSRRWPSRGARRGDRARRVRLRPHGGRLGPRHRGPRHRQPAVAAGRAGLDPGDRPAVRRRGPRPAGRAGGGRARPAAGPVDGRQPRPDLPTCARSAAAPTRAGRCRRWAARDDAPRPSADDRPDPAALLDLALAVAREAAALVRERRTAPVEVADTKTSPTDVVTEVDRASEDLIRARLLAARPDDAFLGEEAGSETAAPGCAGSSTRSTARSTSSTASRSTPSRSPPRSDGEIVAGVVLNAATGVEYAASLGGGRHPRDGAPIGVRADGPAGPAAGDHRLQLRRRRCAPSGAGDRPAAAGVRDIRRLGSSALDLCYVADGYADAYVEEGVHLWDHAAAGLIAREAGATHLADHEGAGREALVGLRRTVRRAAGRRPRGRVRA